MTDVSETDTNSSIIPEDFLGLFGPFSQCIRGSVIQQFATPTGNGCHSTITHHKAKDQALLSGGERRKAVTGNWTIGHGTTPLPLNLEDSRTFSYQP